ncbi:MAG: diphthamide synthesis protein [Nanoarchaeota archaeon]
MEKIFVEAKYEGKINLKGIRLDMLPNKVGVVTTVQFVLFLDKIKDYLISKKVFIAEGKQKYKGQVLGCEISAASDICQKVDSYLYIGTGQFHPIIIAVRTGKDVYCYNPISGIFRKIMDREIEIYKKKKKGAYLKFLSSDTIGILVSIKPGQRFGDIDKLKKKFGKKKFYTFGIDTLDFIQLNNFPFIQSWVNTACPRMEEDISVVNIGDLE